MPPSRAPVMLAKGFTSQVPRVSTSSMLQVPNKSLPTASIRKCQAYKTASNSQVPHKGLETASIHKCQENLQNASTHICLPTASTHRCRIKACKLLQFPLARKTCEMLSTHHLLANCLKSLSARNCKLLQFFRFPPMLCCVVLCCAMLCCVILCCVMLYYTMPCYALPRNIMPRYIMRHDSCHATPCHVHLSCLTNLAFLTAKPISYLMNLRRYISYVLHRNLWCHVAFILTNAAQDLHSLLPTPPYDSI